MIGEGRLLSNLSLFARVLRAAGMAIGPGRLLVAVRTLEAVGVERRDDVFWALHSVFVHRRSEHELFQRAFDLFWRGPRHRDPALGELLSQARPLPSRAPAPATRRLARDPVFGAGETSEGQPEEFDAALTWSGREGLRHRDFEQMSADEIREAEAIIARFRLPVPEIPRRRLERARRPGRLDMRATLRAGLRYGGQGIPLRWRDRRPEPPPIVALCDVSGSMSRYARPVLHFLYTLANTTRRVHVFTFGTRLTNVTRHLDHRDVDVALHGVGTGVRDWSGGTRIGACLREFNLRWSRRVLGQGAVVLLISDGLDRDAGAGLEREIERLHKSCRRLIWLNPLLRYEGFEPKAAGIRAMLPHVDHHRPVHNLESLHQLGEVLVTL